MTEGIAVWEGLGFKILRLEYRADKSDWGQLSFMRSLMRKPNAQGSGITAEDPDIDEEKPAALGSVTPRPALAGFAPQHREGHFFEQSVIPK